MTLAELQSSHPEFFENGVAKTQYVDVVKTMVTKYDLQLYTSTSGYFIVSRNPNLANIDINKRILFKSLYSDALTGINIVESVTAVPVVNEEYLKTQIDNIDEKINTILKSNTVMNVSMLRHLECLSISKKELKGFLKNLSK